jgi:drug/metabolite transporter (DMT)-like permease
MKMKLKPLMIFLATYLFALILFVALSWMLHPDLEQPLIGALWVIGGALVCHHLLLIGYTKALKIESDSISELCMVIILIVETLSAMALILLWIWAIKSDDIDNNGWFLLLNMTGNYLFPILILCWRITRREDFSGNKIIA